MESVKTKKTITKNQTCLDPFSILPMDLILEILLKLPVKSVAKLVLVSKLWSSTIRKKDFTTMYITRSITQPRLLFVVGFNNKQIQFLESCSQEDPSSDHQRVIITPHPNRYCGFSPPVRGLICRQYDTQVMVGNPSTGQFLTLPKVKTKRKGLFSFFGYDAVNDVYKVLCMTLLQRRNRSSQVHVSDEHQVFTLGPNQNWRKITCKYPHRPHLRTKGICIDGVVYYCSWTNNKDSLMCFNLTTEEFNVVKLPEAKDIESLVNYGGKIALCRTTMYNGTLNLQVLEDAKKQQWSKVSHLVPSWTDLVGTGALSFKGKLSTGQLIFAPFSCPSQYPYFLISYNPHENSAKKVVIQGIRKYCYVKLFFDHVDSLMVLSIVS